MKSLLSVHTQERDLSARSVNGWVDADWDDDLVNEHEDEQRYKQERWTAMSREYREGPTEVDSLMQSLDDFDYEQEDIQDQLRRP